MYLQKLYISNKIEKTKHNLALFCYFTQPLKRNATDLVFKNVTRLHKIENIVHLIKQGQHGQNWFERCIVSPTMSDAEK